MASKYTPFELHQLGCDRCQKVDFDNPATLQNACLKGAPLLRDHLSEIYTKKARAKSRQVKRQFVGDKTKASKDKLKQITMYAG